MRVTLRTLSKVVDIFRVFLRCLRGRFFLDPRIRLWGGGRGRRVRSGAGAPQPGPGSRGAASGGVPEAPPTGGVGPDNVGNKKLHGDVFHDDFKYSRN